MRNGGTEKGQIVLNLLRLIGDQRDDALGRSPALFPFLRAFSFTNLLFLFQKLSLSLSLSLFSLSLSHTHTHISSRQMLCIGGSQIPFGWSFLSIARVPMAWSPGDVWTAELDLPLGVRFFLKTVFKKGFLPFFSASSISLFAHFSLPPSHLSGKKKSKGPGRVQVRHPRGTGLDQARIGRRGGHRE